ncbi:MAG: hypothetical protein ACI9MR_001780 [Myxococcota bacterium]
MRGMKRLFRPALVFVALSPLLAGCPDDTISRVDAVDSLTEETVHQDTSDPDSVDPDTIEDTGDVDDTALDTVGDTQDPADTQDADVVGDTTPDVCLLDPPEVSETTGSDVSTDVGDIDGTTCDFSPPPAFDDHSVTAFTHRDCIFQYGYDVERGRVNTKFVILDFGNTAASSQVHFYEPGFYALHDEWYWFRLLNGEDIPGFTFESGVSGFDFATIDAIYVAFLGQTNLPLGLLWLADNSRLYASKFYDHTGLYGSDERPTSDFFGAGTLLYYPAVPDRAFPEAFWAFELEQGDRLSVERLTRFFDRLRDRLPASVGDQLRFIARSNQQTAVVEAIDSAGGPYAGRGMTYDDLIVEGAVEVYNPGITAGYIRLFPGETFNPSLVQLDDIVVLGSVPDDIPPVAGIISAVPQTALAHVNLLAKSRGTPNAYVAGAIEWEQLDDWEYFRRRVILEASDQGVRWKAMTNTEYETWISRKSVIGRTVPQVEDIDSAPYFVDLTDGGLAGMQALVPLIGGKSAGMRAFVDFDDMVTPDAPMAISIRAYHAHLASLRPLISAVINHYRFNESDQNASWLRFLTLEGEEDFRDANVNNASALRWLDADFADDFPTGSPMATVRVLGGIKRMIRDKDLDPAFSTLLTNQITTRFAHLSNLQGIRFRSSATAEDVAGFNGAGLYDSNTGFLAPALQPNNKDHKKTLEWAIKKTWGSYWAFGAYEERAAGGIDHFSGNMGVLVHPRFDDPKELANGVITYYLSRYNDSTRLIINVQDGAISVTNPDGTSALPEIDEVTPCVEVPGRPAIFRAQASTEVDPGELILSDAELVRIDAEMNRLANGWLDNANVGLPQSQHGQTVVLDLEFKKMADGWPALASGETRPGRFIYKQVRVLDAAPQVAGTLTGPWADSTARPLIEDMPRDIRTVAQRVESVRHVESNLMNFTTYQVYTEPDAADLFPFSETPFVYRVSFSFVNTYQDWGFPVGPLRWMGHDEFTVTQTPSALTLTFEPAMASLLGFVSFETDGADWTMRRSGGANNTLSSDFELVNPMTPFASASEYLKTLIDAP